jgi:4-hydroxyacetophenone monooxygenase
MTLAAGQSLGHATDRQLETALGDAELPSLMPALAYLTGDTSLVASELRPPANGSSVVLAAQGGMTPAQQALAGRRHCTTT